MSTAASIGIYDAGRVTAAYLHSDGGRAGFMLRAHYSDPEKAAALIALGDLSYLGASLAGPGSVPRGEYHEGLTAAYTRDYGDDPKSTEAREYPSAASWLADTSWADFHYLYVPVGLVDHEAAGWFLALLMQGTATGFPIAGSSVL